MAGGCRGKGEALEGRGPAWELSRLPGPQWAGQSPSAPFPLLLDGPSHLSLLISLASLLCPQDSCGLDGALDGGEVAWELSRLPRPEWARPSPSALLLLLQEGPSHLPLLISLASGTLILSGFHFSSLLGPPTSYRFTLGFLPALPLGDPPHKLPR